MHYSDLSNYERIIFETKRNILYVGWLGKGYQYPQGVVSAAFINRLWICCQNPVAQTKGYHTCELCSAPEPFFRAHHGDQSRRLGSAETWVRGPNGTVYAAPDLIFHYVVDHSYLPPAEFIQAVLEGTLMTDI